jgi:hypothetical protein
MARLRAPHLVSARPTRLWGRGPPTQGSDCLAPPKGPPADKRPDDPPRAIAPTPLQGQEWAPLGHRRSRGRPPSLLAGGFSLGHLVRQPCQWLPLTDEPWPEPRRHRGAIPEAQVLQRLQEVPVPWHQQPRRGQQALEAIDHTGPVTCGREPCPVKRPAIFCVDAGDVYHTPDLAFARRRSHQPREPRVTISPIVALHLQTRCRDHDLRHALSHPGAVAPEAVMAGLVAADNPGGRWHPKALRRSDNVLPHRGDLTGGDPAFPGAPVLSCRPTARY